MPAAGVVGSMDADERFRAFVVDQRRSLLRTAYLLTGAHEHADDLVQTALLKPYRHWGRVSGRGDPTAYVRRVVVTTHIRRLRRLGSPGQVIESVRERPDVPPPDRDEEMLRALR